MAYLIGEDECTAVRALLVPGNDPGLSEREMPNSVILLGVYAGAADRSVKRDVPTWAADSADPVKLEALRSAVTYRTAALILSGYYQLITSITGDLTSKYSVPERAERAGELAARADQELETITGISPVYKSFVLAGSMRGR